MMKNLLLLLTVVGASLTLNAQTEITLEGNQLFGSLRARHIGPALMSGRISDIEAHPTNNKIIYAGTAGGGVWKSTDGGVQFNPIFDKHIQSIGCVAVDPNEPDKNIWVGTGEVWVRNSTSIGDGLYKSEDGGINWKHMGFEKSDRIASIEINPENSNEIYVGVLGALWGDSMERGVYKTTDGGATWEQILKGTKNTGCSDLIMDPNDPNTLYAAFWEFRRTGWSFSSGGAGSALYKSTDAGATWNKVHNGFPSGDLGRFGIAIAPSNSKVVYAVVECEKASEKGLYRSDDGGATWSFLNNDFALTIRPFYFSRVVVDPRDEDVVVKGGLWGAISRDGGKTFKNLGSMHADIHDILFDINNSERMYVATDGGLYRSFDGGSVLDMVDNMPVSQFYHISYDMEEPYNIYGGLQDNGCWYGPSAAPGGVEARDWNVVGIGDGFRVLRHPEKKIIYSEMQGAENVWRYDIDKKTIKTIQPLQGAKDPKLRFNWNAAMAISPNKADRFYVGSQFLHKSEDMGDTWEIISPDLSTNNPARQNQSESGGLSMDNSGAENNTTIFTIAESPLDEKVIWVGTDDGNVQVTKDGGKTWKNTIAGISGLPKYTWCYHIEASSFDKGTAYAVFDGHTVNDMNTYAYKTTDYGTTWTSIVTDQIDGFARSFQEDLKNENILFLGTEKGLYVTIDGGKNWSKFENNMPSCAIHHMEMHPRTNDLIMGTHGRGIIIIDDLSLLRQISAEMLAKDVYFFEGGEYIMHEEGGFGGTSTRTQFVGDNPSRNGRIMYYLKKRHTFGKMTMDVYDEAGNHVTNLEPKKQKGINIVEWGYNMKAPKVAKGKTFDIGSFAVPKTPAGKYRVEMKKGKEVYEMWIEVKYDPKSSISVADRKEQQRVSKQLFDMTQDLAYAVETVDAKLKFIDEVIEKNPGLKKKGTLAKGELQKLKETLVVTSGDNYVGVAEPQLREKIGKLYGVVTNNLDKPSSSQMQNFTLIENLVSEAISRYEKIDKGVFAKFSSAAAKADAGQLEIKSKEEFLK